MPSRPSLGLSAPARRSFTWGHWVLCMIVLAIVLWVAGIFLVPLLTAALLLKALFGII